jgi:hypothetical protein
MWIPSFPGSVDQLLASMIETSTGIIVDDIYKIKKETMTQPESCCQRMHVCGLVGLEEMASLEDDEVRENWFAPRIRRCNSK